MDAILVQQLTEQLSSVASFFAGTLSAIAFVLATRGV